MAYLLDDSMKKMVGRLRVYGPNDKNTKGVAVHELGTSHERFSSVLRSGRKAFDGMPGRERDLAFAIFTAFTTHMSGMSEVASTSALFRLLYEVRDMAGIHGRAHNASDRHRWKPRYRERPHTGVPPTDDTATHGAQAP